MGVLLHFSGMMRGKVRVKGWARKKGLFLKRLDEPLQFFFFEQSALADLDGLELSFIDKAIQCRP